MGTFKLGTRQISVFSFTHIGCCNFAPPLVKYPPLPTNWRFDCSAKEEKNIFPLAGI
jgi:hypothetical protein